MSLMQAGYYDEARAWRDWLIRAVAGMPEEMQIMYGVAGERRLMEWQAPWLPGYENSRPVNIGNAAFAQRQLDVYGEVMDALHEGRLGGLPHSETGWSLQTALLAHLGKIWCEPDEGIWEIRGPRRHFTHSKVMAWVAFDRAVKDACRFGMEGPVEHWAAIRDRIHAEVLEKGFDRELGSFVQAYGSKTLDASLLLIPLLGFLPAGDPRMKGTLAAIEQRLVVDGFVLRYDTMATDDGLSGGEGAFLACNFWLVDNLVLAGRRAEARALFERLLALRNDVGLLAEEYDPVRKRQVGNFPQAFSHIALANTAANLTSSEGPGQRRSR